MVSFKGDKKIQKAKALLKAAITERQKKLTGPRPPDAKLKTAYAQLIDKCGVLRGGKLFYPYLSSGIGKGALVQLADGSVKYDFITGIGVHYLGHNSLKLLDAAVDAALEDTIIQGNLQQNATTVELFEMLTTEAGRSGAGLKHCFLSSSGAMANENALKMIFQKRYPAGRMLAFRRAFAGRSMVLSQMTDRPDHREGLPKVMEIDYLPFYDPTNAQGSTEKALNMLHDYLKQHPGQHAGMCFELVQGEGGYYAGSREFFVAIMEVLKANKIAIMIDEIQTFGRTSKLFAFQYFQLDKYVDVVSVGKLTQVCATLFTDEYIPKPGLISQTFIGNTVSIYAAKTIIKEILKGGYLGENGKIMQLGNYFRSQLEDISRRNPQLLKGPFGLGAMVGVTVFEGDPNKTKIFLQDLFEAGVIAFSAGQIPARLRFLMPMGAVTKRDIDVVSKIIEQTLVKTAANLKKEK